MKIKQLISELQKIDQEMEVGIDFDSFCDEKSEERHIHCEDMIIPETFNIEKTKYTNEEEKVLVFNYKDSETKNLITLSIFQSTVSKKPIWVKGGRLQKTNKKEEKPTKSIDKCWQELGDAINRAKHEWLNGCSYCETQLLSAIGDWSETEQYMRDVHHPCEGYYKAILNNLVGPRKFINNR